MSDPCTVRRLRVYDDDGVTLRGEVDAADVSWRTDLGGAGSASYTVPFLADLVQALGADVLDDAVVKYATNLGSDPTVLTDVYAWLSVPAGGTLISEGEVADKGESYSCRSLRDAFLSDWLVASDGFPGPRPQAEGDRYFGFMSRGFDDSGWAVPQSAGITLAENVYPAELTDLDPEIVLISVDSPNDSPIPEGQDFVARGRFTTTAPVTAARVYAIGDDYLEMYLDGEQLFTTRKVGVELTRMKAYDVDLLPGEHVLAARVTNGRFGPPNFTWLFALVTELDKDGKPVAIINQTSHTTGWKVHPDTPRQGETAARILLRLLGEAAARGITSAANLTPTFTATTSTEGAPWTDLQERPFALGDRGLDVALELDAERVWDLDVTPSLQFHAYKDRGTDRRASVAFVQGVNIVSLTHKPRPVVATRVWVQTAESWSTLTATAAEAAGTRPREAVQDVGKAPTTLLGKRTAQAHLADLARTVRTYTFVIEAMPGCVPFVDFDLGDIVTGPDHLGVPRPMQVISIGTAGEDEVKVLWTVEAKVVT